MTARSDYEDMKDVLDWVEAKTGSIWPTNNTASPNRIDIISLVLRMGVHQLACDIKDYDLANMLLPAQRLEELNWDATGPDIMLIGAVTADKIAHRLATVSRDKTGKIPEDKAHELAVEAASLTNQFADLVLAQDQWTKEEKVLGYRRCGELFSVGSWALRQKDEQFAYKLLEKIIRLAEEKRHVSELTDAVTFAVDAVLTSSGDWRKQREQDAFEVWNLIHDVITSEPESDDKIWLVGIVFTLGFMHYHLTERLRWLRFEDFDSEASREAQIEKIRAAQEEAFQLMFQRFQEWDDKCWQESNASVSCYWATNALYEYKKNQAGTSFTDSLYGLNENIPDLEEDERQLLLSIATSSRSKAVISAISNRRVWASLTAKLSASDHKKIFDNCVKHLDTELASYPVNDDKNRNTIKLLIHGARTSAEKAGENAVKQLWTKLSPIYHPFVQNGLPIEISNLPFEQWNESCLQAHATYSVAFYKQVSSALAPQARPRLANAFAAISSVAIAFDQAEIAAQLIDELSAFSGTTPEMWFSTVSPAVAGSGPHNLEKVKAWAIRAEQMRLSGPSDTYEAQAAVNACCALAQEIAQSEPELADALLRKTEKLLNDVNTQITANQGDGDTA